MRMNHIVYFNWHCKNVSYYKARHIFNTMMYFKIRIRMTSAEFYQKRHNIIRLSAQFPDVGFMYTVNNLYCVFRNAHPTIFVRKEDAFRFLVL